MPVVILAASALAFSSPAGFCPSRAAVVTRAAAPVAALDPETAKVLGGAAFVILGGGVAYNQQQKKGSASPAPPPAKKAASPAFCDVCGRLFAGE